MKNSQFFLVIKCLVDLPQYKIRLIGEWLMINCTVTTSDNVTVWYGNNRVTFDNKKIKLVSKNVFNLTNITHDMAGGDKQYTCRTGGRNVCGTKSLSVYLLQGKACC